MIQGEPFFAVAFVFCCGTGCFFFSELSAFNSLLKDMDCQNGRKQWSQHHDMTAQLVFVWCFFFLADLRLSLDFL